MSGPHKVTPKRKAAFLASLRAGLSVSHAADSSGFDRKTWYEHRKADPAFAAAWDDACEQGADRLEDEAVRRAVEGVRRERAIVGRGGVVGTEVTIDYSDTLLIFLLKGRRPEKYAERRKVDHNITDHRKEAEAIAAEIGKAGDTAVVDQIERDLLVSQEAR